MFQFLPLALMYRRAVNVRIHVLWTSRLMEERIQTGSSDGLLFVVQQSIFSGLGEMILLYIPTGDIQNTNER